MISLLIRNYELFPVIISTLSKTYCYSNYHGYGVQNDSPKSPANSGDLKIINVSHNYKKRYSIFLINFQIVLFPNQKPLFHLLEL